jgi:Fic family protein
MALKLQFLPIELLEIYVQETHPDLEKQFDALKDADISTDSFSFYTSISAIASSKIEGERMEIDSYIKHKMLNIEYLADLIEKPNDLYQAYLFAQKTVLSADSFLKAHAILAEHLLPEHQKGAIRTSHMLVMEHKTFRVQYEAAPPYQVKELLDAFWDDIELLKKAQLSITEVFYFAAFIHLSFVNIHPFNDGNGRSGRLLEKWFLAEKLGEKAWFIQSELNYYRNIGDYYKNLNRLGIFYEQLDYSKALPFLKMLASSLG